MPKCIRSRGHWLTRVYQTRVSQSSVGIRPQWVILPWVSDPGESIFRGYQTPVSQSSMGIRLPVSQSSVVITYQTPPGRLTCRSIRPQGVMFWQIFFFYRYMYSQPRPRVLLLILNSITVRSAAPQTSLRGGPGPRFEPETGDLEAGTVTTRPLHHHLPGYQTPRSHVLADFILLPVWYPARGE